MPNRYYSPFADLRLSDPGNRPKARAGVTPSKKIPGDREHPWPVPKPAGGPNFNRTTKWPTVRASVVKRGGPFA